MTKRSTTLETPTQKRSTLLAPAITDPRTTPIELTTRWRPPPTLIEQLYKPELRAVQAQWDAGNYIVGNTNDVRNTCMINTPSDTTRKNDAQRSTASSSHPSCAPSLNGSILSAGKQNSIQFQWMPSEAMKNYAMHWSWRHCAPS